MYVRVKRYICQRKDNDRIRDNTCKGYGVRDEDIRVSIKAVRRSLSIFHHGVIDIFHVYIITVKTISRLFIFMKGNNM